MTRLAIMVALAMTGCGEPAAVEQWDLWARAVEARLPVGDGQGHGPDVGSEEWSRALQQKLGIVDAQGHGPDIGSAEWRSAVEEKLP